MLGELKGKVDDKRRVNLPRKLRLCLGLAEKGTEVILARGLDGCIWLLTISQWSEVERSLEDLRGESFGFGSKETRAFIREFYRRSVRCALDSHGRVLLPERLMELTGIQKDVVFIVMPERTEVWAVERDPDCSSYEETAEKLFG